MGSVRSVIELADRVSGPAMRMSRAVDDLTQQFESVKSQMGENFDTSGFERAVQGARDIESEINSVHESLVRAGEEQNSFNQEIERGSQKADGLTGKIKGFVAAFVGIKAVKGAVSWIQDSLDLTNVQLNAERQLNTVLKNVGAADDAFQRLKDTASSIQGYSLYGDEAMLGGAAELATYIKDADAIQSMMGTLANYSAGMSGGGEVNQQQMVEYATQLGKALDGTYDGLKKKGFELSDSQKAIIENGTDMQRALVLDDVINQSWANLAEQMANLPEGRIIKIKNEWGDIRETIGAKVYPAVLHLFDTFEQHLPQIENLLQGLVNAFCFVVFVISEVIDAADAVYTFFSNNWSLISPIIYTIVGALIAYKTAAVVAAIAQGALTVAKTIALPIYAALKGATMAETAEQWKLNSALYACPLAWILMLVIAIIGAVYAIVAAINAVTGKSISATGVVCGILAVAGAFVANLFMGLLDLIFGVINALVNPFVQIANFFANVWENPISSVIYLFQGLADSALAVLEKIASAMDFVFGGNMADTVAGWRAGLKEMADAAVSKYAPNENYQKVIDELDLSVGKDLGWTRFDLSDAYDAGYKFGEDVSNFDLGSLFPEVEIPEQGDYTQGMGSISGDIAGIAEDTKDIKNTVSASSEELKYLREIAERQAINQFTTAEIKVDMTGMTNKIDSEMDIDGIINIFTKTIESALISSAEGVHI